MTLKVDLGAPSLTGKGANALVAEAFAGVAFPAKVTFTSNLSRDIVLPEAGGLFLAARHGQADPPSTGQADIASIDQLQRIASTVEQISELNGYALAITIEIEGPEPEPALDSGPAANPKAPRKNHAGDV